MFERFVLQRLGTQDIPARKWASDTNRSLLKWISRDRSRPFFAFVNYMDVHDPYLPPQPFRDKFSSAPNPGGLLNWRVGHSAPKLTPEQLQSEIDAYDGAISYVDDQIGRLLEALRQKGLYDHLLIVITSDHGEAFGEHRLYLHGHSLYREVIHVPLIIWWPGKVPENLTIERPVSNASLPATLLELIAGREVPFPGPSLANLWEDPEASDTWLLPIAELAQQPWVPEYYPVRQGWVRSVVSPDYHFIEYEKLPNELYRWPVDVRESANLAKDPKLHPLMNWFQSLLHQFVSPKQADAN